MIDYVKILITKVDIERLYSSFEFISEVSESTGELSRKRIAKYHFCDIVIYNNGIILLKGSIHKLWNSLNNIKAPNYLKQKIYKGYNGNQFTLENIIEVRKHLESLFNCGPQQMIFQNIEIGINTTPLFNPNLFLKGLLFHKNKPFEYRYNRNLAISEHNRFYFKIYNKSNQYEINEFTLRIELKVNRMEEIKRIGLKTFSDVNEVTMSKCKELLVKRFDEVVNYDYTIKKEQLSNRQLLLLKDYSNVNFWINDLKPNHRDRHKKRLKEIIKNNSDNLQYQLRQDLIQKCVIINRLSESSKCVIVNSSNIALNITQTSLKKLTKKCIVTGIDLNLEKEGSIYIKTATLKHLYRFDLSKFQELCSLLLNKSKGSKPRFEQNLIKHLAKQIRNRYYNQLEIRQTGYRQKKYSNQYCLPIN